ncbi:putative DNA modification/repair radical SAM protein [Enterococcus sp. PF1-24]|uniref:putative DNA modification/repair radical SAM protein n=1 Tax=unclassified Enterococcus TaxID=2608891 RepID=UPI002476595F|nr:MULTISPECIES: putative DNA modification/repair radical SAM protein [unclassified Enterococcus]MDH6365270.1 putative DNA modification/repair radical SAM protein [Enterococcus sp. PFB1-1]MDH6402400.1 putative DNA modification/repair radical SAM protein [Enterococcus sp. PF1-24]
MELSKKIAILAESAKYDVSCSSSGVQENTRQGKVGSTEVSGICHSFTPDGRCVSLLKLLFTNACIFDCHYCINRKSNHIPRATFTPQEVADLTMDFYMRNYIEGLFLSSAIIKDVDYTCELLIETLKILRHEKGFRGYIHVKAIPGADEKLIEKLGFLADRMSVNVELPSRESLKLLAPDKNPYALYKPMKQITETKKAQSYLPAVRKGPSFVPAGQSTQMIIGASPENDRAIVKIAENLYGKYELKRVYYSAYIPVNNDSLLPAVTTEPPLLREHRLYQADWLMRYYKFSADEILSEDKPNFNLYLDPKANWAVQNYEQFPVDVQTASYDILLRIPGVGPKGARNIMKARKYYRLHLADLKKLGIVIKRAQYFITCNGESVSGLIHDPEWVISSLISSRQYETLKAANTQSLGEQLSLFDVERFEHTKNKELAYGN